MTVGHAGDLPGGLSLDPQGCEEGTELGPGWPSPCITWRMTAAASSMARELPDTTAVYSFTNVHGWVLRPAVP